MKNVHMQSGKPNPAQERAYVLGSLIVTGAAALIVELVGARVLSPYYGSSIYCWSAIAWAW